MILYDSLCNNTVKIIPIIIPITTPIIMPISSPLFPAKDEPDFGSAVTKAEAVACFFSIVPIGNCPKIRDTFLEACIIQTIIFWVPYGGPLF